MRQLSIVPTLIATTGFTLDLKMASRAGSLCTTPKAVRDHYTHLILERRHRGVVVKSDAEALMVTRATHCRLLLHSTINTPHLLVLGLLS